jgi:hypothetical protein
MDMLTVALRLAIALLLGSAIGIEREWYHKMAGLRTNALVALGAAGYVVFSAIVDRGDPTRVAGQVVSGIGFLGAGVILREGINVSGINTAATLWCSAIVGTLAGAGFLAEGTIAAGFVLVANFLLRPLVRRLNQQVLTATDITVPGRNHSLGDPDAAPSSTAGGGVEWAVTPRRTVDAGLHIDPDTTAPSLRPSMASGLPFPALSGHFEDHPNIVRAEVNYHVQQRHTPLK